MYCTIYIYVSKFIQDKYHGTTNTQGRNRDLRWPIISMEITRQRNYHRRRPRKERGTACETLSTIFFTGTWFERCSLCLASRCQKSSSRAKEGREIWILRPSLKEDALFPRSCHASCATLLRGDKFPRDARDFYELSLRSATEKKKSLDNRERKSGIFRRRRRHYCPPFKNRVRGSNVAEIHFLWASSWWKGSVRCFVDHSGRRSHDVQIENRSR